MRVRGSGFRVDGKSLLGEDMTRERGYQITALIWSLAGLIAAVAGDVSIAGMSICIGMMFLAIGLSKKSAGGKNN
jgi:hypothetical protein